MQTKAIAVPFAEYNDLSDKELMEFIVLRDDDAAMAFASLIERYKKYVWTIISNSVQKYTTNETIEDLLQDIFLRVWQKADTFGKNVTKPNFKSWLGSITNRITLDWLSDFQFTQELDDACYEMEQPEPTAGTEEQQLYFEAIDQLTEREQEIITLYYETHDPRNPQSKAPRAFLQTIYKKFNISNDGVRQIRLRSKKKIEDYVTKHLPGKYHE